MKWGSFFLGAMIVTSMFAGSFYGAWLANKSDVESLGYSGAFAVVTWLLGGISSAFKEKGL
jgi:hypothetical protein